MIPYNRPPEWVYPGAKFDLDFRNNRYFGGFVSTGQGTGGGGTMCTNNGAYTVAPYTPQKDGQLVLGKISANRITDLGLFVERATTNRALWCRDMTQSSVWTASGITPLKNQTSCVVNETGNNASSITAITASGTILQSVTLVTSFQVFSAYVKRLSGAGSLFMTQDNGATYTDVTSQINSTSYNWVQIPRQSIVNPVCGFLASTSGDSFAIDFNQQETATLSGNKATTPIFTTTTSVARTNEATYFSAGGIAPIPQNAGGRIINDLFRYGGPWSMLMSFNGDCTSTAGGGPAIVVSDGTQPASIQGGSIGPLGGSGATPNSGTNGRGNWNKACIVVNGNGRRYCLNGSGLGANVTTSLPSTAAMSHFNIGNNGSGTGDLPLNGSIGRVTFFASELTIDQMQNYSLLINSYDSYP